MVWGKPLSDVTAHFAFAQWPLIGKQAVCSSIVILLQSGFQKYQYTRLMLLLCCIACQTEKQKRSTLGKCDSYLHVLFLYYDLIIITFSLFFLVLVLKYLIPCGCNHNFPQEIWPVLVMAFRKYVVKNVADYLKYLSFSSTMRLYHFHRPELRVFKLCDTCI